MKNPIGYTIAGLIFLGIGITVFAIRLTHPGPYAMPTGAAPIGAVLAIALGGFLLWSGKPKFTGLVAIVIAAAASLPALFSILGEAEEVVSLYAPGPEGNLVDLRLWIVDREDGAWVGMGRSKAVDYQLDGAKLDMLRAGATVCVVPKLYDEDREMVSEIHGMKVSKYKAAQFAGSLGLYPLQAGPNTVALRLDPC